jgi:hypothetical protein
LQRFRCVGSLRGLGQRSALRIRWSPEKIFGCEDLWSPRPTALLYRASAAKLAASSSRVITDTPLGRGLDFVRRGPTDDHGNEDNCDKSRSKRVRHACIAPSPETPPSSSAERACCKQKTIVCRARFTWRVLKCYAPCPNSSRRLFLLISKVIRVAHRSRDVALRAMSAWPKSGPRRFSCKDSARRRACNTPPHLTTVTDRTGSNG